MDGAVDKQTRANVIMDIEENKANAGQLLYASKFLATLAANLSIVFYINTGPDFEAHMRFVVGLGNNASLTLRKASVDPTSPVGPGTAFLRKHQKDATAAAETKLFDSVTGGTFNDVSVKAVPSGYIAIPEPEFILEPSSWYQIDLNNLDFGPAVPAGLALYWYEVNIAVPEGEDRDNPALLLI